METIKGFGTAKVIVITLLGKQKIYLNKAAYILGFYINLVYNQRLNKKGIFQHNEGNYLYYRGGQKFAYCGYYYGQITLKYNELKPRTKDAPFMVKLTEPLPNQKVDRWLWYSRLGHVGSTAIKQLPKEVTGAIL